MSGVDPASCAPVVSDRVTHAEFFAALEQATTQLGRKVAPIIYSSKELSKRMKQENAFVTRVLAQPKLWLIGDERVLAAVKALLERAAETLTMLEARWVSEQWRHRLGGRSMSDSA
jgi:hypothetical protein